MDSLTANMEMIDTPGSVSGAEIVYDICDRLAEKLLSSDCLRESDAYSSYAATITATVQLTDVYPVAVAATIHVGTIHPQQPSRTIALDVPAVEADMVRARSGSPPANLERFTTDDAGATVQAAAPKQKYYVPTGRPRGRPRKA
jgi:hypothetical protein